MGGSPSRKIVAPVCFCGSRVSARSTALRSVIWPWPYSVTISSGSNAIGPSVQYPSVALSNSPMRFGSVRHPPPRRPSSPPTTSRDGHRRVALLTQAVSRLPDCLRAAGMPARPCRCAYRRRWRGRAYSPYIVPENSIQVSVTPITPTTAIHMNKRSMRIRRRPSAFVPKAFDARNGDSPIAVSIRGGTTLRFGSGHRCAKGVSPLHPVSHGPRFEGLSGRPLAKRKFLRSPTGTVSRCMACAPRPSPG